MVEHSLKILTSEEKATKKKKKKKKLTPVGIKVYVSLQLAHSCLLITEDET